MSRVKCLCLIAVLAPLAMAGLGCARSDDADPVRAARTRQAPSQSDRDQYGLARLVDDARRDDTDTGVGELERLRQSWLHTRVHWEVGYAPAFCRDGGACMALPFDHGRLKTALPQGWLPELALDLQSRRELAECCAAVEGQCVFGFHGTLARFELGRDRPTSLSFRDVEIDGCRVARAGESWVRRSPRAKSTETTDPHVALSRTGPREG